MPISFVGDSACCVSVHSTSAASCMKLQEKSFGREDIVIGPFRAHYRLSHPQISLLNSLSAFYTEEKVRTILHPYANQESTVSLRSLDWLVTNFAKKMNIVSVDQSGNLFNIFHGYKLALSNFRRRNFDPFRRRLRIGYEFNGNEYMTTVGQANFLHWAYVNGILEYARINQASIETDMNSCNAHSKRERVLGAESKRKRKELSKQPSARCWVYKVDTTITF